MWNCTFINRKHGRRLQLLGTGLAESSLQIFNESGFLIPFLDDEAAFILAAICREESCGFCLLELVFTDENEIVRINKEFLDRSYVTDVISFRYDEHAHNSEIEGTIYCCAPRIEEQAAELGEDLKTEFLRIFIHGVLHLAGYEDGNDTQKLTMTRLENHYLELFKNANT